MADQPRAGQPRPATFGELLDRTERAAKDLGFFLDRSAPSIRGMNHVGWYCPTCEQRLSLCNKDGHRAGPGSPWNVTDCKTPGTDLIPMYVPTETKT